MQLSLFLSIILPFLLPPPLPATIGDIPVPPGYQRLSLPAGSVGEYLRRIPLRANNTVYLYNGQPKTNQSAQFAVTAIPIRKEDILQCADAVILLRASYLFESGRLDEICFRATDGTRLSYADWCAGKRYRLQGQKLVVSSKPAAVTGRYNRKSLDAYLDFVFRFAGTASLARQLVKIDPVKELAPGDVFLQGGFPGHIVLVVDMAADAAGRRKYLLLQGYMPSQDIHVLRCPANAAGDPWYSLDNRDVRTPEWHFPAGAACRFAVEP